MFMSYFQSNVVGNEIHNIFLLAPFYGLTLGKSFSLRTSEEN